ncbi:MAG: response regulator [Defluviitaleaceae bacterium]|nr:response regulator [Defluviitaleaceae bacterium]
MDLFIKEQQIYESARNHLSNVRAGADLNIDELSVITKAYGRLLKHLRMLTKAADETAGNLHNKTLDLFDKDLAKSRFLARMSHEIRTPISAVLGISEIQLQDASLPTHVEESFAKIYSSAQTLLGIVNDILDLSKIEAGKMSVISDEYDVASMINDVINLNMVYLLEKNLSFRVRIDENIPARLYGDEIRLKQILNNLLSNAFKYTNEGFVEFCCWLEEVTDEDNIILGMTIRDTGLGMAPEQLETLNAEYSRFHEKEQRSTVGTGLGMPITFSLASLMDATMDISSEVNVGSTWTLKIPQETINSEIMGAETARSLESFQAGVKAKVLKFERIQMPYGKVLVVDDVDTNLFVARGLLALYGLQIETCTGGREAITKIENGDVYDIIFLDHMMPGLDGIETLKILRSMDYIHPIIALTANAILGQSDEYLQEGFDGVVSKPIQTLHLNAVLNKFILEKHHGPDTIFIDEDDFSDNSGLDDYLLSPEIQEQVREDFVKSQKDAADITAKYVNSGDLKLARQTVHTLRGIAGLLSQHALAEISENIELTLKKDIPPSPELLDTLKKELLDSLRAMSSQ